MAQPSPHRDVNPDTFPAFLPVKHVLDAICASCQTPQPLLLQRLADCIRPPEPGNTAYAREQLQTLRAYLIAYPEIRDRLSYYVQQLFGAKTTCSSIPKAACCATRG